MDVRHDSSSDNLQRSVPFRHSAREFCKYHIQLLLPRISVHGNDLVPINHESYGVTPGKEVLGEARCSSSAVYQRVSTHWSGFTHCPTVN